MFVRTKNQIKPLVNQWFGSELTKVFCLYDLLQLKFPLNDCSFKRIQKNGILRYMPIPFLHRFKAFQFLENSFCLGALF